MSKDSVNWTLDLGKMLPEKEVGLVLAISKKANYDDYLFFATAANTGFRISEVLHLRGEDIRDGQVFVVRRKKNVLHPQPMFVAPEIMELLVKRTGDTGKGWLWPGDAGKCSRQRQRKNKETGRIEIVGVETLCTGGHLAKRTIQRRFARYAKKAGVGKEGRGTHALRHYAGAKFYAEYRDLRATQLFLGHSSSKITETYAHVVDMREKIEKRKPIL